MNNNSAFNNDKDDCKKANQNLEQKYRLLFEKSPVGIFQFDNNAIIIDCNDRFIEILKSSREKVIGLDMHNLKDKSVLNACLDAIKGVQGFYEGIYHVTTSDATIYVSLKTVPFIIDGTDDVLGGMGTVEDITERVKADEVLKKKEQDFRILSSLTTDAASVLSFNPDGTFNRQWLSDSLLHTVGYSPDEIDSFEKWAKIVHPEDLHPYKEAVGKIMLGQKVSLDFRVIGKNGKVFWVNNTVFPEYDESGKPVRLISALKDITAEKEAVIALDYQRNLLDTIINIAPVSIWLSKPDGS